MNTYRIYAVDADDHEHRVFMYTVRGDSKRWVFKTEMRLRALYSDGDEFFVDRWDGVWYIKQFKESDDGQ